MKISLDEVVQMMLMPSFEMDADSAAVVLTVMAEAIKEGVDFCPMAIALATVLRLQLADLQDDSERCVDDGLEEDVDDILPYESNPTLGWVPMKMANGKMGQVRANGKSNAFYQGSEVPVGQK